MKQIFRQSYTVT